MLGNEGHRGGGLLGAGWPLLGNYKICSPFV